MSDRKANFWISYADLMTILTVIFLFISLAYMGVVQKEKKQQDKIFHDYKKTKEDIYNDLNKTFANDYKKWQFTLDKNLSIKFTNPDVLFASGSSDITPRFKEILSAFFPKYLSVIMQNKYRGEIAEIRIEGHTDTVPLHNTTDSYIDNLELSQDRSRTVLQYLRQLPCYDSLKGMQQTYLQYWLTATGFSYGRTLDSNNNLTIFSGKPIDNDKSRRVEFRIIPKSEALVDSVINQMGK